MKHRLDIHITCACTAGRAENHDTQAGRVGGHETRPGPEYNRATDHHPMLMY